MSSGLPVNTLAEAAEYRKRYMAYLALEAQNEAYNLRANQVYKLTGQPSRPPDTRTTTEKLGDIEEMKVSLMNQLMQVTDGQMASNAVNQMTTDEILFASQAINTIISELKPKFARGVPSQALLSYIRSLKKREEATSGVSFQAQEATAQSILSALQAGRAVGAPIAPFAPSVPMPTGRPPALAELAAESASRKEPAVPARKEPAVPARKGLIIVDSDEEETPVRPKNPFEQAILERSRRMGIDPEVIERRGRELEKAGLEERRGEVKPVELTKIDSPEEFMKAPWTKIMKWYKDWSPLIPEMEVIAMSSGLVLQSGQKRGELKYRPKSVPEAKADLLSAFRYYLSKRDEAALKGSGFRRRALAPSSRFPIGRQILGLGLSSKKSISIDMTQGIVPGKKVTTFVPFGKYIINPDKLSRGILEVKTLHGGKLNKYPVKEISPKLTKIMRRILDDKMDEYDFNEMDMEDQNMLYELARDAKINDRLNIPTPKLTKDGEEMNRFEILKGQIIAGNDNREMVKEFKTMLLKLSNEGRIKKGEAREILMDLTALGY